jgi:hypothetical protein
MWRMCACGAVAWDMLNAPNWPEWTYLSYFQLSSLVVVELEQDNHTWRDSCVEVVGSIYTGYRTAVQRVLTWNKHWKVQNLKPFCRNLLCLSFEANFLANVQSLTNIARSSSDWICVVSQDQLTVCSYLASRRIFICYMKPVFISTMFELVWVRTLGYTSCCSRV